MFTKRTNLRHSWQRLMDLDLLDYQTFSVQSASCGPSLAMDSLVSVIAGHVLVSRGSGHNWQRLSVCRLVSITACGGC